jgi:hypothetical protein
MGVIMTKIHIMTISLTISLYIRILTAGGEIKVETFEVLLVMKNVLMRSLLQEFGHSLVLQLQLSVFVLALLQLGL